MDLHAIVTQAESKYLGLTMFGFYTIYFIVTEKGYIKVRPFPLPFLVRDCSSCIP